MLGRFPHPGRGFTQGIVVRGSTAWESTGLYGQSALHRYQLGAPQPERSVALPPDLFAEGICQAGEYMWQLTWRERVALRWDPHAMQLLETIPYNREGWGICQVGDHLVTSDGSSELIWRDPQGLKPAWPDLGATRRRTAGRPQRPNLGRRRIWANVWTKPYLAAIDPATGQVTDVVDGRAARERFYRDPDAIMNGISALPIPGELLLTGKRWRWLYHVRLAQSHRGARVPQQLQARP